MERLLASSHSRAFAGDSALAGAASSLLAAPSLIDERFDHDSCGVGFVASVDAVSSHDILQKALIALSRLAHRGATAADGKTSDGVGVMTAIPRELLVRAANLSIDGTQLLGVGMVMVPVGETRAEALLERCLESQDLVVLGWRDVPVRTEWLGEMALGTMPRIRQVLVVDGAVAEPGTMERRLYLARKQFERAHVQGDVTGYICSLSSQTIVYKAMCTGELLHNFYPDLAAEDYVTPFCGISSAVMRRIPRRRGIVRSRGRKLGHNGEINTVWGNRARMTARDSTLPVECKPVLTVWRDGLDKPWMRQVELLSQNGRTLAEAIRMLLPRRTMGGGSLRFCSTTRTVQSRGMACGDCVQRW
ncbi:MAG: hypothetical protein WDN23_17440 [Edaphobacter sp.]